jgi:hypothetical protein
MKIEKGKAFATVLLASLIAASLLMINLSIPVSAQLVEPPPETVEWLQKLPAIDYAQSGVPDFDQKQDNWNSTTVVSYTLFASNTAPPGVGWGFNPQILTNPTLRAVQGDTINLTLASADGNTHRFHLDYNNNGIVDPGEPESPSFGAVPIVYAFTLTQSGKFTYRCSEPWTPPAPPHPELGPFNANPTRWTWCGPVAVANSLWWWDSHIDGGMNPPPAVEDHFPLVQSYGFWDDHDPANVMSFVEKLAGLMRTDVGKSGTNVFDMQAGIDAYLEMKGLNMSFYERTLMPCTFEFEDIWVEFEKCEDVVLLLGFYEEQYTPEQPGYKWVRIGGHYVTVAGVGIDRAPITPEYWIKLSDPFLDYAESMGWGPPYVPIPHPAHVDPSVHNNATLVSHDPYKIIGPPGLPLPGIHFGIEEYPVDIIINESGLYENGPGVPGIPHGSYQGGFVYTGVEYAIIFSPTQYDKPAYPDYAPSKMPDFDQRQDNWFKYPGPGGTPLWSWCGPVAVANSLWWMDSKFEPGNTPPPTISDGFPLVQNYGPWDDHDVRNVGPFIQRLATLMKTDIGKNGTNVYDMEAGIRAYLEEKGLNDSFYERTWYCNFTFADIEYEVEKCEDVILLLGRYELQEVEPGVFVWVRINGHYVTVSGVNANGTIKFSDPILDWAEVAGRGEVLPPGHAHGVPYSALHNDTLYVSHDYYSIIPMSPEIPGVHWGIDGYPWYQLYDFMPQGDVEPEQGLTGLYFTGVEYAVIISPLLLEEHDVAVIAINKTTEISPGVFSSLPLGAEPNMQAHTSWRSPITINVTVENQGNVAETFSVTVYNDSTPVGPSQIVTLNPGQNTTLTFIWDHRSVNPLPKTPAPVFTITANATLLNDIDPGDNSLSDGTIKVKHPGDAEGDGKVYTLDFGKLVIAYREGTKPEYPYKTCECDFDGDGRVYTLDFGILVLNYRWGAT